MSNWLPGLRKKVGATLRWSERYTKTDMTYLAKGGFWLTLGHGIQIGSGLVLAVAFANLLPKESYGIYQFIMSTAAILSALTLSGMSTAIKRAVARGNEGALRYGFRTQMLWSINIALAAGALATYYFVNGNNTLATGFLIVGAFSPFIEGFSLYKSYLIGTRRFKESALLGLWRRPLFIVTILITLFLTDDPTTLVFVYFASSTLSAWLLYRLVVKKYTLPTTPDPELLGYSKHLSVMGVVSAVGNHTDKILIFHFLGAAPLAIYVLALLPFTHLSKLFDLSKELAIPRFVGQSFERLRQGMFPKVRMFLTVSTLTILVYIPTAPYIFSTLFPNYPEAVLLSQAAVLILLIRPSILFNQVFTAHGTKNVQYFLQVSSAFLKVGLLLILIPLYGLWGALIALMASQLYTAIALVIIFYSYPGKAPEQAADGDLKESP